MKPLNVLYLVRTWAFGGSHTIVLSLLEHMPRDQFRIHCVPYDAHSAGDAEFIAQATARNLEIDNARIPWRSSFDWFRARNTVSSLIRDRKIDLIHTHDPHSNMLIGIGRNRWPVPVIASAYGWWDGELGRRRLHQRIERDFALPNFDRVITVSEDMRDRVLDGPTLPEHVSIVHTGLAPMVSDESKSFRKAFNIPADAIVVGTVGRVSREKGHRYLLDAIHKMAEDAPRLHCVIVGTGPALEDLQALTDRLNLQNRVTFTGFWNDRTEALNAFDIFVLPSIEREGLPTSVLEAQQAGLPVIASNIGGTSEAIDPANTGILAEPGDTNALIQHIRALVHDAQKIDAMGSRAREWIDSHFSLRSMIENVSSIYSRTVQPVGADADLRT